MYLRSVNELLDSKPGSRNDLYLKIGVWVLLREDKEDVWSFPFPATRITGTKPSCHRASGQCHLIMPAWLRVRVDALVMPERIC